MQLLNLNPLEIWSFYPDSRLSIEHIKKLVNEGWVHPIPVFEIPEFDEPYPIEHKYLLMDGAHRRNAAIQKRILIPSAVYQWGEEIKVTEHGLMPFDHANDPKLYERIMKMYIYRKELPEIEAKLGL